ncbi:MAG TPA: MoaD/ThiS family protein [Pirellulaceae bacterium]|jgi:sulfur-carrier protein|nr:MoaD/ThiS family protein [Pirellulaceae bacterium]
MPNVFIPPQLRDVTGGIAQVTVEAQSVRQAIDALEAQFPGIKARLCKDDELVPGLQASVDQTMTTRSLRTPLKPASELHFLPAFGGG